jgi:transposase
VKLIAPQLVKPYVKRGKNDAADAEALCEAMSRPTMRFVPVKTAEQQGALMLVGLRDRLIRNRAASLGCAFLPAVHGLSTGTRALS